LILSIRYHIETLWTS